jgi:D-glycero-D-manno-heptose 1,7-bisphosphate phosphatase
MKLVILDRDGVINENSAEFIKSPAEWHPLPGSIEAIARLSQGGYTVAVATNQSGIRRGLLDLAALAAIHRKMEDAVAAAGGRLAAVVFCPHGPDDGCDCRKPRPGLLRALGERFGVSLEGVPVVGDSERDLAAAQAVGARPILVLTGSGQATRDALGPDARVEIYEDLRAAADKLLVEGP